MAHHSRRLVGLAALVIGIAGFVGVARAELIEPAAPVEPPVIKAFRPVPLPAARPGAPPSIVFHRPSPARTIAAVMPARPQVHCGWFDCGGQYLIVGIGF